MYLKIILAWLIDVDVIRCRPETNLRPWNEEFPDIKVGSHAKNWSQKFPHAYWKGNPDVASPLRVELLKCNDTERWGAQIMRQVWVGTWKLLSIHHLDSHIEGSFCVYTKFIFWVLIIYCAKYRIGLKQQQRDLSSPNYRISVIIGEWSSSCVVTCLSSLVLTTSTKFFDFKDFFFSLVIEGSLQNTYSMFSFAGQLVLLFCRRAMLYAYTF